MEIFLVSMNRPRLTVIVTTFNQAAFVDAAVVSVLTQEFSDLKIIVADDASTDGTVEVLCRLDARFPGKLRLLFQPKNLGVAANRNSALARAKDEFILFLDGDDQMLPGKLGAQMDFLDRHPDCAICCHDVACYDASNDRFLYHWKDRFGGGDADARRLTRHGMYPVFSGSVFRRSLIPKGGFNEQYGYGEDWLFSVETLMHPKRPLLQYVEGVFGRVNQHNKNISSEWDFKLGVQEELLDYISRLFPELAGEAHLRRVDLKMVRLLYFLQQHQWRVSFRYIWDYLKLSFPKPLTGLRIPWRELRFRVRNRLQSNRYYHYAREK